MDIVFAAAELSGRAWPGILVFGLGCLVVLLVIVMVASLLRMVGFLKKMPTMVQMENVAVTVGLGLVLSPLWLTYLLVIYPIGYVAERMGVVMVGPTDDRVSVYLGLFLALAVLALLLYYGVVLAL